MKVLILVLVLAAAAFGQKAVIIAENANLRGTAAATGKVVTTLTNGMQVDVLVQNDAWFLVQSPEYVGWIHGSTIRLIFATLGGTTVEPRSEPVPLYTRPAPRQEPDPVVRSAPRESASRSYMRGPRGGCYYLSGSGRKVYVDRSLCS